MGFLVIDFSIFGSIFVYEAAKCGNNVKVIEKIVLMVNLYGKITGIDIHIYETHIFHIKMKNIWDYVNKFATFNNLLIVR